MAEEKGERRSLRNKSENDKEKEIITIEVGENTRQKDDNAEQSIEGTNKPTEEENTQEEVTSDQNIKIIKFTVGEKDEDRRSRSGRKIKANRKYSNPDKQEDLVLHGLQPYWVVASPPEQNATALFGCVMMSH